MTSNSEETITIDEVIKQLQAGSSMPAELLEIFGEEADDHLRTIYDGLNRLQNENGDMAALMEVRRASHTLKGAAGAVNLQAATRLAHRMEDLLDLLAERNDGVTEKQLKLLLATADQLQGLTTGDFDVESIAEQIVELYQSYALELGEQESSATKKNVAKKTAAKKTAAKKTVAGKPVVNNSLDSSKDRPKSPTSDKTLELLPTENPVLEKNETAQPTQYLRVPLNRLDELVGLLGEMIVNRSEFQQRLDDFEARIEDMQSAMERLRNVAQFVETHHAAQKVDSRPISSQARLHHTFSSPHSMLNDQSGRRDEFDQLEFEQYSDFYLLEQTLSETDNDAEIMSGEFRKVKTAFDSLLRRQRQLNHDAQESLMRIRMVPLNSIVSRLERTVRTVSKKVGRVVELEIVGEQIELDKTVLDAITDPILHLIRNAIDHGVEDVEVRAAAGKPEAAHLRLKAVNQGTQVTLQISDDGAGINLEKVRQKAIQQDLISEDQEPTNEQLHALIFQPGFSTAEQLTDVSGRGVGMDVVGDAIHRLKGTIRVDSEAGTGTTFTIQLPTTLGLSRAVLVESCGKTFAFPMQSVQQIHRLDPSSISWDGDESTTRLGDRNVRLIDLASHLNLIPEDQIASFENATPMLRLGSDDDQVVVAVDAILGSRDIVVKTLGDHLKKVRGIIGATIGGDGSVIPILDTTDLVERNGTDASAMIGQRSFTSPVARRNTAMVIDDSISVRRVTESLFQFDGWCVVTAKDGVDALEKLAELDTPPDVFLCDMEMPRMDGFELIRQIREQHEFEVTPIIMVTSRASEKHRQKAFEAGASDYVVKPYNDEQLLELATRLVETARETVVA